MEKIVKQGENNVEVFRSKKARTLDDSEIEVWSESPESYGASRLAEEMAQLDAESARLDAFDVKAEKAKIQKKRDVLLLIKAEMEKGK